MTTTTRNEAAQRLLNAIKKLPHVTLDGLLEPGYTVRDLAFNLMANDVFEELLAAERRATVERIDWQEVRSAISNAYYETREAGGTMEAAADSAVAAIRSILDEDAAR